MVLRRDLYVLDPLERMRNDQRLCQREELLHKRGVYSSLVLLVHHLLKRCLAAERTLYIALYLPGKVLLVVERVQVRAEANYLVPEQLEELLQVTVILVYQIGADDYLSGLARELALHWNGSVK